MERSKYYLEKHRWNTRHSGLWTGIIRGVVTLTDGANLGDWRIQVSARLAGPSAATLNPPWNSYRR
jgi:hypothetical protein